VTDSQLSEARQVLLYHSVSAFNRLLFCVFSIKSPTSTGEISHYLQSPTGGDGINAVLFYLVTQEDSWQHYYQHFNATQPLV